MLEGLLSAGAGELYEALVRENAMSPGDARAAGDEMAELIEKGFARYNYRADPNNPSITPIEPVRAVDNAIMVAQQQALEQQRVIIAAREQLELLQAEYRAANGTGEGAEVEVITDRRRIGALSVELCLSAREEFVSFTTASVPAPPDPRTSMTFPASVTERGVVLRNVYERDALDFAGANEIVHTCARAGWQLRVAPALPMKMVIADHHSALVPVDRAGTRGALCVRTPTVVAALRMLFELVWAQAVPVGDEPGNRDGLTPVQGRVLDLVATGMTDAAIARNMKISERTVRRHVSSLLEALRVDNRVAAVYAATRIGWLR